MLRIWGFPRSRCVDGCVTLRPIRLGRAVARAHLTSSERLKALERENLEHRSANQILKDASVFFANELDRGPHSRRLDMAASGRHVAQER